MKKKKFLNIFACSAIFIFWLSEASQIQAQTTVTTTTGGTTNYIPKFSGSSNIENSSIFDNGMIGIGTINPLSLFHITKSDDNMLRLTRTNVRTWRQGINSSGFFQLTDITAGYDRLTIDQNGNVGIGTTSPLKKLHVYNGASGGTPFASSDFVIENSSTAVLQFLTPNTNVQGIMFGDPEDEISGYLRYSHNDNSMRFYVNGLEKVSILNNGKVGIGTTTPTEKLDVNGFAKIGLSGDLLLGFRGASIEANFGTNDNLIMGAKGTGHISYGFYNGTGGHIFYNGAQGEILRFTSAGKVGIGTTNPISNLHLNKSSGNSIFTIENSGNGFTSGIDFNRERSSGTGINGGSIFMNSNIANSDAHLYIQAQSTSANAGITSPLSDNNGVRLLLRGNSGEFSIENGSKETMRFASNNSVGIGTTTPSTSLHILTTAASGLHIQRDSGNSGIRIQNNNDDVYIGMNDNDNIALGNSADLTNAYFQITQAGNVGIGTTNPVTKLDIDAGEDIAMTLGSTGFGSLIRYERNGGSYKFFTGINDASYSRWGIFDINRNALMTITSGGNVGIGTTDTFGYKLAVNGTIGAKEVNVETTSAWPDYVFDEAYELPSLESVEAYTQINKHLPNVPTGKEIKENGLDLGKMNTILLQKIEELTLYVINQQKQNAEQQKQIDKLTEQLNILTTK